MRDPDRIPELCQLLQRAWELDPDLRLGQLVVSAVRPSAPCAEVFYAEDGRLRRGLRRLVEQWSPPPPLPSCDDIELDWATLQEPQPTTVTFDGARVASFDAGDDGQWFCELLEIRFGGAYRRGSEGNPDAHAMALKIAEVLWHARGADVVVLDLSALRYEWGNSILQIFEVIERFDAEYPVGVVVLAGPDSEPALRSLGVAVYTDVAEAHAQAKIHAVRRAIDIG